MAFVTFKLAILSVVTLASAILLVVTAASAIFAVTIPKSFTLNGLAVVPAPSIVDISDTAPKPVLSNQATTPEASVTRTLSFPPEVILAVVTFASWISAV